MSRTAVYSALVLRNRPSGESNSEITLLTAEEGIIRATVFGGAKSKLRSHAAPYNSGQVWIYRDPSKDYRKLSDFDVHSWRPGLRELYERTMAAGAMAETVLLSHGGGGDWSSALKLASETLDTLENASEELCSRLFVHFLWRWADLLGIQPQVEHCAICTGSFVVKGGNDAADSPLWFSASENSLICTNCIDSVRGLFQISADSRRWLASIQPLESSLLHRYSIDGKFFQEAKSLATAVMTGALGKRLSSWDW